MSGNELPDTPLEPYRRRLADLQAETAQNARRLDSVSRSSLHQFARGQHGTRLLGLHRLAMHRPEPA
jgi:hypothetical protein